MKIIGKSEIDTVTDVLCDLCRTTTRTEGGHQFAALTARWGYGSRHDGERYELHLCEQCFFEVQAYIKRRRFTLNMFDEDYDQAADWDLGLVVTEDDFDDDGLNR